MMTTSTQSNTDLWSWEDALDALIAAPKHHKLLMENEHVRVLETLIQPGERTAIHTHRWQCVTYVISWSPIVRYDHEGVILLDSRTIPEMANPTGAQWTLALPPHALENVGTSPFHVISIEIKK